MRHGTGLKNKMHRLRSCGGFLMMMAAARVATKMASAGMSAITLRRLHFGRMETFLRGVEACLGRMETLRPMSAAEGMKAGCVRLFGRRARVTAVSNVR